MNVRSGSSKSRRIAMLAALPVVAGFAAVIGTATPAAAAACGTMGGGFTHNDGVASVSFTAVKNCSNHDVRVYGTLRDTLADSRSVRLGINYSGGTFGNDVSFNRNGAGTSVSFDHSAGDTGEYVQLCLMAFNSFGQSSTDCENWYF